LKLDYVRSYKTRLRKCKEFLSHKAYGTKLELSSRENFEEFTSV
jgi:hypothetical protein